jgi:hypothetical protein
LKAFRQRALIWYLLGDGWPGYEEPVFEISTPVDVRVRQKQANLWKK